MLLVVPPEATAMYLLPPKPTAVQVALVDSVLLVAVNPGAANVTLGSMI
jgi:hypothetical protein